MLLLLRELDEFWTGVSLGVVVLVDVVVVCWCSWCWSGGRMMTLLIFSDCLLFGEWKVVEGSQTVGEIKGCFRTKTYNRQRSDVNENEARIMRNQSKFMIYQIELYHYPTQPQRDVRHIATSLHPFVL